MNESAPTHERTRRNDTPPKNLTKFLQAVRADIGLQEQLRKAGSAKAVVALARGAGYEIAPAELTEAPGELSEEELEGVADGAAFWWQVDPETRKTLITDGLPD